MKSKKLFKVLFIIFSVGIASSISLIGGLGIEAVQHDLVKIIPLLIALPALNSLVGDYATLIAAHAGDPTERGRSKWELVRAMLPSVATSTLLILGLSTVLGFQRGYHFTASFLATYVMFVVCAIISVITVMFILTLILDALLKKQKLNPDDILIPIVTTISDIFMLGLIALAVKFIF